MFFDNVLVLLLLMSEPDILGTSIEFTLNTNILLKNNVLSIFKLYISREKHVLIINILLKNKAKLFFFICLFFFY